MCRVSATNVARAGKKQLNLLSDGLIVSLIRAQSRYPTPIQVLMWSESQSANCSWIEKTRELAHMKGERNYYFYNYWF